MTVEVSGPAGATVPSAALGAVAAAPTGVAATDTAVVQAAIDSIAVTGGTVWLRPGVYLCNQITVPWYVGLRGAGQLMLDSGTLSSPDGATPTHAGTVIRSNITNGADLIVWNGSPAHLAVAQFSDFVLLGTGTDGNGLVLNAPNWATIARITAWGFGKSGILQEGGVTDTYDDCVCALNVLDGFTFQNTISSTPTNLIKMRGCTSTANTRDGVRYASGSQLLLFGCDIENNGGKQLRITVASGTCVVHDYGSWYEPSNSIVADNTSGTTTVYIHGSEFPAGSTSMGTNCVLRDTTKPAPLAIKSFRDATDTVTYGIAAAGGTAMVAVDTANLRATFVVPESGRVRVKVQGTINIGTIGNSASFGVMAGATIIAGQLVHQTTLFACLAPEFLITGLTPGATKVYDFAWKSDKPMYMLTGPTYGEAIIEVLAA